MTRPEEYCEVKRLGAGYYAVSIIDDWGDQHNILLNESGINAVFHATGNIQNEEGRAQRRALPAKS